MTNQPNTTPIKDIDTQIESLLEDLISATQVYEYSLSSDKPFPPEYLDEAFKIAHKAIKTLLIQSKIDTLDALYWMYVQYCGNGHDFMNAGESASELLQNSGYIKVDGVGRILVDNGDSHEQKYKAVNET